jgi:hypothetical protein
MKAIILTDDTKCQLPSHNKWTNRFGCGSGISKESEILTLLKKGNDSIPSDDLENEIRYRNVLHEFIRPAKNMFGGRFSEVRTFAAQLSKNIPVEILIISGRYGLIDDSEEIIPYDHSIQNITQLKILDEKNKIFSRVKESLSDSTHLIILLPKFYIEYLIKKQFFETLPSKIVTIIVTSKGLQTQLNQYENVIIFERKGVARLRSQNCDQILSLIQKPSENINR